jgi:cell division protein FtsW
MGNLLSKLEGDRVIWLVVIFFMIYSGLSVYSTSITLVVREGGNPEAYLLKQLLFLATGFALMYICHKIDYRYYAKFAQIGIWLCVALLVYTLIFGVDINDAKRWVRVPVVNVTFQTSDFAKLAVIMFLSRMLALKQDVIKDFNQAFMPMLLPVALVVALIAPEDLSTAMLVFLTAVLLMFIGRVSLKHLAGLGGIGLAGLALMVMMLFAIPEDNLPGRMATWKGRIESFSQPGEEQNLQVQQANIAIANGGWLPNGPGNSIQKNSMPLSYSDYIFPIIIEEYGIILGGAVMIILYLILLYRCVRIVIRSPKAFGAFLAVGLGFSLVLQAMVNMGVGVNLLPVTGMTLPLVSMGGSSIWFTSMAVGIILSISRTADKEEEAGEIKEEDESLEEAA